MESDAHREVMRHHECSSPAYLIYQESVLRTLELKKRGITCPLSVNFS